MEFFATIKIARMFRQLKIQKSMLVSRDMSSYLFVPVRVRFIPFSYTRETPFHGFRS